MTSMAGTLPGRHAGRLLVLVSVLAGSGLLASRGGSSSPSTTSTTVRSATATTTPAEAALAPMELTVSDFPAGWTKDTAPGAASTAGIPACVAGIADARRADARVHAVFVGPGRGGQATVQTVATFASGTAATAVADLRGTFLACNGTTFTQGQQTAHLTARPLNGIPTGDAGFAAETGLTVASRHIYLDGYAGTRGDVATMLLWRSPVPSPALFAATAATALDRLE